MVICKLQRSVDVVHRGEEKEIIQNTQNNPGICSIVSLRPGSREDMLSRWVGFEEYDHSPHLSLG